MIKTPTRDGSVVVTFELPAAVAAESVSLCGEFNDWSETSHPLNRTDDGFKASVELTPGQRLRFRYLLDGARWENDWAADGYIGNEFGGEDSIVDLTDIDLTDAGTVTAPEPPATADKPSGTRRRKPAADAPASAPARGRRTTPATESAARKSAGSAENGKPKRAASAASTASAAGGTSTSAATSTGAATDAGTKKPTARKSAAAASEGAEKKPATSRRKSATSRQSGKDA